MTSGDDNDGTVIDEAKAFVEETERAVKHTKNDVPDELRGRLQRRLNELRHKIEDGDEEAVADELDSVRGFVDEHLELQRKSVLREYVESIGMAVVFALILRGFVIEAFKIPTGSMIPTLLVGDHLFVNKFVYGIRVPFTETFVTRFNEPSRGEVVVFTFPTMEARRYVQKQPAPQQDCIETSALHEEKDFIKRVVAVEGDRVAIENDQLILNGEPVERKFLKRERTGNFQQPEEVHEVEYLGGRDYTIQYGPDGESFGPVTVREDHVFVMGDNRDNSSDSRCWGQVPIENVKGRAMFIWWSIGPDSYRWDRIGRVIE